MSILERKLAEAVVGSPVRIIQSNGQSYEGIVTENDGTDSISLQISQSVTIRYSQIMGIETNSAFNLSVPVQDISAPFSAVPVTEVQSNEKENDNIEAFSITEEELQSSFKNMGNDEKKFFSSVYSKFQSALKSHDNDKLNETVALCWDTIQLKKLEKVKTVNDFYAKMCILNNEYEYASLSFAYAEDIRSAYLSAYTGAEQTNDNGLYVFAGAYSALYLCGNEEKYIREAADILMRSSEKYRDISGLKYVAANMTMLNKDVLSASVGYLARKCGNSSIDSSDAAAAIIILEPFYNKNSIIDEIKEYNKEFKIIKMENSVTEGRIISYDYFEKKGRISDKDNKIFDYELADITDNEITKYLKKITSKKDFSEIEVRFTASRKMGRDAAVSIERLNKTVSIAPAVQPQVQLVKSTVSLKTEDANYLYSQGEYEKAIEIYRKKIDSPEWEDAFAQIMGSYAALWKKTEDESYSYEMAALINRFEPKGFTMQKSYETIMQYYMKVQNYSKALSAVGKLIESCGADDYYRLLNYLIIKSRCYRHLGDYRSAISQLNDWIDIVTRKKITERYDMRKSTIYIELAELYYELEDYESSSKYSALSSESERKQALVEKLEKITGSADEEDDDIYDDDENDDDTAAISLQEAYDGYSEMEGFDELGITDADAAEKLSEFDENHLYCLISWLSVLSDAAGKSNVVKDSVLDSSLTMAQSIKTIESAFSYAYCSPIAECSYISTNVINLYKTAKKLIPECTDGLMAAAALRTLFAPSAEQDYYFADLMEMFEGSEIAKKYPMLISLMTAMRNFYESTGCAVDSFAGYKSNVSVIDGVIADAKELCEILDRKNEVFESQGQVRRMREYLFSDEKSLLRKCLNIVAENDTDEFKFVRSTMENEFIRSNRPLTADNADTMKIDELIDEYWDKARDIIVSEGRHIARPHDKIKGSKRNNIIYSIKKIISCVCDWLAVAEHSGNEAEAYIMEAYSNAAPQIISALGELNKAACAEKAENKFNWGTDSICKVSAELLAKMEGTYNAKDKKYFFIGFLEGDDILLNDDYLPELQSTFFGWGRMNILGRIERHAAESHPVLSERLEQIISQDEAKHNFRTARLIMEYADDIRDNTIVGTKSMDDINKCLKIARQRFESMYADFCDEIELYENYGMISNINGEKTVVLKLALDWYRISRITCDYGFYTRMLNSIKNMISINAAERGQELIRQLEELADKPDYDFGIYTKEEITALIDDQNYTSAESILNCIRRHDTNEVHDYTAEPYRYFNDFISEQQTDYRAVVGAGKNIVDAISDYSGIKDLEKALIRLTNNARKETKGGSELLKNWPRRKPANQEDLMKLLTRLGFGIERIVPDGNNPDIDSYIVHCYKRRGKVTYFHPIPAFSSLTETEGMRVAVLYGKFDCDSLMSTFRQMNSTAKHTLVLLDFAMNIEERRRLARKIKEEKSFSKVFIVVDRVILFYLAKHYSADTISRRLMAVTLPFAYYQPFVEASTQTMPAELFTGREAELTQIESPDGVNLVYGGRQLGKSALLKMAQHNVDKNGNNDRAVLLDVQYKNYQEVAKLLSQELITRDIIDESCECDNWDDLARHINKRLMDDDPETRINYLLIMLDEADEFIKTSAENNNPPISAVKNLPSGRFKLVMAGLHNLSRFNREMLHGDSTLIHLSSVVIKQFQRAEAIKLLTNTLAYLGFRFNKEVISNILNKTNYYPGLIQFYCQKLLEAMKNEDYAGYNELNTPYYEISESHFKKVLADSDFTAKVNEKLEASLFTEEKGRSHYHIIALILAFLYYDSPSEKKYTIEDIMKIAEEYRITRLLKLDRGKIEELLNEMWDLNVVSKEDSFYRFATEGFRELLGSKKQVEDEMARYFEEETA